MDGPSGRKCHDTQDDAKGELLAVLGTRHLTPRPLVHDNATALTSKEASKVACTDVTGMCRHG